MYYLVGVTDILVVEFYKNGSLFDYLKNNTLSLEASKKILLGIAAGMTHLHKEGVIHRDLAARNILVTILYLTVFDIFQVERRYGGCCE